MVAGWGTLLSMGLFDDLTTAIQTSGQRIYESFFGTHATRARAKAKKKGKRPTISLEERVEQDRVVELINAARASGRYCGGIWYPPAPPLRTDPKLLRAARVHARSMARKDYFGHINLRGNTPEFRIGKQGFRFSAAGENIAAGQPTLEIAVDRWLASPHHCAVIMNPDFTHTGVASAPDEVYTRYWVQTFARQG